MTHHEALRFIQPVPIQNKEVWADLGAGSGVFTNAIAKRLGSQGFVHALDKTVKRISNDETTSALSASIIWHKKDFTEPLSLGNLDGIFMANSLHFVRNQQRLLGQLKLDLNPTGRLVIIEYDIHQGNPWVPFPVSFKRLEHLASKAGLPEPEKVATRPSRYHHEMYLAVIQLSD